MDTAGIEPATARRSRELSCETGIIPLNQAPWLMLVGQPPIKILGLINLTNLIIPWECSNLRIKLHVLYSRSWPRPKCIVLAKKINFRRNSTQLLLLLPGTHPRGKSRNNASETGSSTTLEDSVSGQVYRHGRAFV